jgi:hypothetical protein
MLRILVLVLGKKDIITRDRPTPPRDSNETLDEGDDDGEGEGLLLSPSEALTSPSR